MQFDDKVPIYYQIENYLYHQIVAGTLQPGAKLPAVRQLAVDLTVNVNTVQRALTEMIRQEILESRRGRGNFVTQDTARITALKHRLITDYIQELYTQLHALQMDDAEIVAAVEHYLQTRGNQG
ncbi:GntR family transcriptional regulator [Levilactobacillus namurensis]|uniref:GntR family transcriptional regulator n=1 Tax=Levilactobacillus namurensis TaxID=380393 RepID=A0AAW8W613_9LACO|nr:GntR family transcriptional regulator [Levilactobacillus namurensis]MCW3778159.1 GntR family transcriptional regulator [Levilactobacillus namurensis]MDT7014972.1 GntR family transcriptional regulator [Levilactobacillus namurensis]MDT7018083.1 GntR family transcriptional regulator [Levilactobacillus namurensis]WNN64927.1 GntR family transcriptional regulator [Levilactobacillus namurensis]